MKKKNQEIQGTIESTKNELTDLMIEHKNTKVTSENNLKYLINLDRNTRKRNVILFSVPEHDAIFIKRGGEKLR